MVKKNFKMTTIDHNNLQFGQHLFSSDRSYTILMKICRTEKQSEYIHLHVVTLRRVTKIHDIWTQTSDTISY